MEQSFQQYMLGNYTPNRLLYADISEGVLEVSELIRQESLRKNNRKIELYFDFGEGYSAENGRTQHVLGEGWVELTIEVPKGIRTLRVDPCTGKAVVRIAELLQNGRSLPFSTNGLQVSSAKVGTDFLFDTEDPQIWIPLQTAEPVTLRFLAEPMEGISREMLLNQYGRLQRQPVALLKRGYRKLFGKRRK